ncbi:MAG: hypothetical protein HYU41_04120 [Candidatus Rokubacteria bacterium]|nr:hypothetical protein [Candidatus Rokubacteria bacterium]
MTKMGHTLLFGAALALATAGCANYVWQKPGTAERATEQDWLACNEEGRRAAARYEASLWMGNPVPRRLPEPVAWRGQIADPYWYGASSSFEVERRVADQCMTAKGYEQVRAPKASEAASPRAR